MPRRVSTAVAKWRRSYFEYIMRWEFVLRAFFVGLPNLVFKHVASSKTVISFFFVYVMLQVRSVSAAGVSLLPHTKPLTHSSPSQAVAILWGFLFNVGAVLGENMITIVTMPFVQALCVLVVYVSVMGIVLSFGRATWILTWQSLQNFPLIRRIIAVECRPQAVILTVALPMLAILPNLILVPSHCRDDAPADDASLSIMQTICEESYLKFLTDKHPVFQRALRLSTAITICQFIQLCLEILPHWRTALSGLSTSATFGLGGWLLGLNVAGAMWSVEWVVRHVGWRVTPLSDLDAFQWEVFGMVLLSVWILWFLAVAMFTLPNVRECEPSQKKLTGLFERLKFTFVIGQGIVFARACLHPNMGFVHAQLELTIINLLLPSIYVVSLIILRMVSLFSRRSLLINAPIALGVGAIVFKGSQMSERPHSFFVVSLFLFDALLRAEAASEVPRMGRLTQSLQQMLKQTLPDKKRPLMGHRTAKKFVYAALVVFLLFVGAVSGFSILSVLQKSADWFPDATSVEYDEQQQAVHIHHTAVVKLHLGLTDDPKSSMHMDEPEYAACSNRWRGLSVIDLAVFAEAAYFDPLSNDTAQFVSTMFGGSLGEIDVYLPELNTKTGSKLDFFEAYIPALNTSVISVRGTDIWRFTDFVEDIKMFFEPVVFAILSAVFPTIRIWPDVTFSTLIELYSEMISLFGLQHGSWYYHELLDYTTAITDRNVILTGHSMGGGIARLVGSIVGKPSVTFSPPGVVQSYSKLVHHIGGQSMKVDRAKLHHHSVAIVPEYDPITMVDAQAGMVQKISCNTPHLSWQLSCHMLEGTLCNLLEHCGDPRGRISSCQFEHRITSVSEDLAPKIAQALNPSVVVPIGVLVSIVLSLIIRRRRISMSPAPSPTNLYGRKSVSPPHRPHGARRSLGHLTPSQRRNSVI